MDMSTAISVFLKQIVYHRAIPFVISEPKPQADNEYTLRKSIAAFEAGTSSEAPPGEKGITLNEFDKRMKSAIARGAAQGSAKGER
jgi:antitoxin component of RelBE/YafQ-DinJ toxin-antitoxin module